MPTAQVPGTGKTEGAAVAAAQAERVRGTLDGLRREIGRVFVGHEELVDLLLATLVADGHVLIEGVPGLGKTLLVRTLAAALQVPFARIQFTPDLMPADITGTMVLAEAPGGGHELRFESGPLMTNVVLADEINRATPRTQSALLEAMQERQVTVGGRTRPLPEPFIVLATQNPIEQEGTYPLPEAQLDRFMVKLLIDYPDEAHYHRILEQTTSAQVPQAHPVCSGEDVLAARAIVRQVPVSAQVRTYAIRLTMATQPNSPHAPAEVRQYVALGASPRAAQALVLLGKVKALCAGRYAVACEDIRAVAPAVLRHRILLNFAGQAERVAPDRLVAAVLASVGELSEHA